MPVKKSGLGLQEPVTLTKKKDLSSLHTSRELIGAITGERSFSTTDHLLALREERRDWKKRQYESNEAKLKEPVKELKATDSRLILCAKNTGSWMTVWDTTVTNEVLAATEFLDFLCASYDITLPNLQKKQRMRFSLLRMPRN